MAKRRKNKYETHVKPRLIEIKGWIKTGMIDKDVAKKLGVAYSTFRTYVDKYEELAEAVKESKEVADFNVMNALYNAAIGYEYEEVKRTKIPKIDEEGQHVCDEEGKPIYMETEVTTTQKRVNGNVSAQQFWLKNRMPDIFRDKIEQSITADVEMSIDDDMLMKMIEEVERSGKE